MIDSGVIKAREAQPPKRTPAEPGLRQLLLLAVAGASLLSSQYIASRELGSTFFVTELSLIAATVITLIGPSLGYALSLRFALSARAVFVWSCVAAGCQWLLPFGLRALFSVLGASHLGLTAIVTAACICLLCGYYSFILPLISPPRSIPWLYAGELLGAAAMLVLIASLPSHQAVLWVYLLLPGLLLGLAHGVRFGLPLSVVGILLASRAESLDHKAAELYYHRIHGLASPRLLESRYSPYQRIDVVADQGEKSLFLDGVPFYRAGDLDAFNILLAQLPATLLAQSNREALVIGSGSFSSAAHLHRLGYRVHVIELDSAVAEIGFRQFADHHKLSAQDITVEIADARTALAQSQARYDLIVLDVPAPYRTQLALLHAPAFYRQVASHLNKDGVAALSLCSSLHDPLGQQIAASAAQAFREVMVAESESTGIAIVYAGPRLPFTLAQVQQALRARDPEGGTIYADRTIRRMTLSTTPLGDQNLFGVLWLSRQAMSEP